jgi:hypothetical protein
MARAAPLMLWAAATAAKIRTWRTDGWVKAVMDELVTRGQPYIPL